MQKTNTQQPRQPVIDAFQYQEAQEMQALIDWQNNPPPGWYFEPVKRATPPVEFHELKRMTPAELLIVSVATAGTGVLYLELLVGGVLWVAGWWK